MTASINTAVVAATDTEQIFTIDNITASKRINWDDLVQPSPITVLFEVAKVSCQANPYVVGNTTKVSINYIDHLLVINRNVGNKRGQKRIACDLMLLFLYPNEHKLSVESRSFELNKDYTITTDSAWFEKSKQQYLEELKKKYENELAGLKIRKKNYTQEDMDSLELKYEGRKTIETADPEYKDIGVVCSPQWMPILNHTCMVNAIEIKWQYQSDWTGSKGDLFVDQNQIRLCNAYEAPQNKKMHTDSMKIETPRTVTIWATISLNKKGGLKTLKIEHSDSEDNVEKLMDAKAVISRIKNSLAKLALQVILNEKFAEEIVRESSRPTDVKKKDQLKVNSNTFLMNQKNSQENSYNSGSYTRGNLGRGGYQNRGNGINRGGNNTRFMARGMNGGHFNPGSMNRGSPTGSFRGNMNRGGNAAPFRQSFQNNTNTGPGILGNAPLVEPQNMNQQSMMGYQQQPNMVPVQVMNQPSQNQQPMMMISVQQFQEMQNMANMNQNQNINQNMNQNTNQNMRGGESHVAMRGNTQGLNRGAIRGGMRGNMRGV